MDADRMFSCMRAESSWLEKLWREPTKIWPTTNETISPMAIATMNSTIVKPREVAVMSR
jgi:hypothetical protein